MSGPLASGTADLKLIQESRLVFYIISLLQKTASDKVKINLFSTSISWYSIHINLIYHITPLSTPHTSSQNPPQTHIPPLDSTRSENADPLEQSRVSSPWTQ
jgi:hypothetical protein